MIDSVDIEKLSSDETAFKELGECGEVQFTENMRGGNSQQRTTFKMGYTDAFLYLIYKAEDMEVIANYTKYNDPLYNEDVCEIFISADGDIEKYYEFEFSPNNLIFAATITNDLAGKFKATLHKKTDVILNSCITPSGYEAHVCIPLSELKGFDRQNVMFNCFRVDRDFSGKMEYYALNPTLKETFHVPQSFVKLNFC